MHMRHVLNHLIQLQDLTLIREQEAFMGGDRLKELDASIAGLTEQLPPDIKLRFTKLQKKETVAVVPIARGVCSTCGLTLPISLVQSVRAEEKIHPCPNCTKILYYIDSPPRGVAKKTSRTAAPKIGIERFSAHELMIPRLQAKDRDSALLELASKMEEEEFVQHADKIVETAVRREAIISTCVDHGMAFPHARGVEGGGLTVALGISPKGIRFNPQEKLLTHIIFFIIIPTAANAFYLKLLAGLTETFMEDDARKKLCAEEHPEKLWRALKKLTRRTIK
ncbi:MAG: hypothetical protein E4H02_03580 [Lentisphaerales bacterium]|nr:MAG: hypothetical protein E4H02_03580 [Lentisphaerales bacterium]